MLDYSPTKTQKLLGNPDKSDNPTASSPACAGLAEEHCSSLRKPTDLEKDYKVFKEVKNLDNRFSDWTLYVFGGIGEALYR